MGTIADLYAATNANLTTTAGSAAGIKHYYDRRFLERVNKRLPILQFAQKRPLPEGNGVDIEFTRFLNFAVSVSGATLTEGVHPDATQFKIQKFAATLAEYGGFTQYTSLWDQASIDQGQVQLTEAVAEWAARVVDQVAHRALASSLYTITADYDTDTTSSFDGTLTTYTSTTSMADTSIASNTDYGDANDDLNQSVLTFTSGSAYGTGTTITDFATSGGVMTPNTLKTAAAVGDTYHVATPDALTTSDKLGYANVKKACTVLQNFETPAFDDGYYVLIGCPDVISGLQDDAKFTAAITYQDTAKLWSGEIGKFMGCRVVVDTQPFRFPKTTRGTNSTSYGPGAAGANYAATGAVYSTFVLGQNCFGATTFQKKSGRVAKPPLIIKNPGPNDTSQPLNRYSTVGWALEAVYPVLNACFGVQIWTGA